MSLPSMSKGAAPSRDWELTQASEARRDAPSTRANSAPGDGKHQRHRQPLPKPTKAMQAHTDLDLTKNSGTTQMVEQEDGKGRGAGFYCEVCKKMCKDSVGYLDHINGRMHLRRLGQTTQAERATLEQVRERIAAVRAERALGATPAQRYNFEQRLQDIAAEQRAERESRRRERREQRAQKKQKHTHDTDTADADVMAAMGFGSFGPKR